ncbi:MAG: thermonuclease family protein [Verrucomicrobiae bacterium]|nr:thermonuclease family protein [Verrucomicrobiae bacterium]
MRAALFFTVVCVALACAVHLVGCEPQFAAGCAMLGAFVFPVGALAVVGFILVQLASQARRRRLRRSSHLTLSALAFLVGTAVRGSDGASPSGMRSYPAQVLAVHDGDTITALIDLGCDLQFRTSIRLAHLDAPELPLLRQGYGGQATHPGLRSRDALKALVLGQPIELRSPGRDKYGRVLGVIYVGTTNVNALLLQRALAKPYEGGKR